MSDQRFARQILMFGEEGQQKIEAQKVGVVGAGGLGSQVCQSLAYTGVKNFVIVDDDRIEETNLNRVAGAFSSNVGKLKTEIVARHIHQINPGALVRGIPKDLRTVDALRALIECSFIFGCVDHDGPRLVLSELASAYTIPFLDTATEIFPEADGQPFHFGGRVVIARPGDYCLFCAEQVDRELAKEDLESSEVRLLRRKHGYGVGTDVPAPAVFALNGAIANLAVMEFIKMVTGICQPARKLTYKGDRGVVTTSDDKRKHDCFTCSVCGVREDANIWRYALGE